jgi:N-dimethylarginine dimethylaminohydrolase
MQTMCGVLEAVMVARPVAWAGAVDWRGLGYLRAPDAELAAVQHAALVTLLRDAGAEVMEFDAATLSADAVYTHDASFPTDGGLVAMRMGKAARAQEPHRHAAYLAGLGIAQLGAIEAPGSVEGGDLVWLDASTLLVGRGFRTNAAGVEQLRLLLPDVDVVEVHLPYGNGRGECLHLMSVMSVLDATTMLIDRRWLSVPCFSLLEERGTRLIDIDEGERESFACNVLSLGAGRLVSLSQNPVTNAAMRGAGFEVQTFDGSEIALNGGGGPTCLTRPLRRR